MGFPKTLIALRDYDAAAHEREELWRRIDSEEELAAAQARDKTDEDRVREAFFEEGPNSRQNAFLIHPDDPWFRRVVNRNP